ncbi:hypothetical protein [Cryobacterium sp. N22]|uniref:hypothetical protein n=1 Tax=Cryobacterium sp. N22 TaxID=2048290 RepID=UPI000CE46D09|nr:hypothetical protein [Cryobacterium sp. N22]
MAATFHTNKGETLEFSFTHTGLMNGVTEVEAQPGAWNGAAGRWFLDNLAAHVHVIHGRSAEEMLTDAWLLLTGRTLQTDVAGNMKRPRIDMHGANDAIGVLFYCLTAGARSEMIAERSLTGLDASRNGKLVDSWVDGEAYEALLERPDVRYPVPGSSIHLVALEAELAPTPRRAAKGFKFVENLLIQAGKSLAGADAAIASVSDALAKCKGVSDTSGTDALDAALRNAVSYISKNAALAEFHQLTLGQWRALVTLLLGNTTGLPSAVAVIASGGDFSAHKHLRMACKKLTNP